MPKRGQEEPTNQDEPKAVRPCIQESNEQVDEQLASFAARFVRPLASDAVDVQQPEGSGTGSGVPSQPPAAVTHVPSLLPDAEKLETHRAELSRLESLLQEAKAEDAALTLEQQRNEATLVQKQRHVEQLRRERDADISYLLELEKELRQRREELFTKVGGFLIYLMTRPSTDGSTILRGCEGNKVTIETKEGPRSYECDHVTTVESQSGTTACSLCSCCCLPALPRLTSPRVEPLCEGFRSDGHARGEIQGVRGRH